MAIDPNYMETEGKPGKMMGKLNGDVRGDKLDALREDLAQLLAACRLNLASLKHDHAGDRPLELRVERLDRLIGQAFALLRQIAIELYPLGFEEQGLCYALRSLLRSFSEQHGISCKLIAEESNLNVDSHFGVSAFRIIQGALEHVARYSQTSEILIKLRCRAGRLLVTLHDNDGRDPSTWRQEAPSGKFRELRARVAELRGRLRVVNVPTQGSRINISLPLPQAT